MKLAQGDARTLATLAEELEQRIPGLKAVASAGGLKLEWGGRSRRFKPQSEVGRFEPKDRKSRIAEGRAFVDVGSGTVFVGEADWLLYLTVKRKEPSGLTPYQCALLAELLVTGAWKTFVPAMAGQQVDLIVLLRLETGLDVAPMAMSRFLEQLDKRQIVVRKEEPKMDLKLAMETILSDFRISMVGKEERYAGTSDSVEGMVASALGSRFAGGIAGLMRRETSALVEPKDYLVDRSALGELRSLLGQPVDKKYRGDFVKIRTATRVPLGLLTGGSASIQPLLGAAVALNSSSPVQREAGAEIYEKWKRRILNSAG